jgi:Uma2 family endonuclease
MTYTPKLTFADYLALADTGLARRAELIDGELIELPPESGLNTSIAMFVVSQLLGMGVPYYLLKLYNCEIQTPVLAPKDAANRYPDLVVIRDEHVKLCRHRMTITLDMPPPSWVMEVVSPGKNNRHRDYIRKRAQYAAVGIPEYVMVDPPEGVVLVLQLENGFYQEVGCYQGQQRVNSPTFPTLDLTAAQIFAAGQ